MCESSDKMRDETNLCYDGVIFEGTADIASVCYCYKKGSQELGASINLALLLTSDLVLKNHSVQVILFEIDCEFLHKFT